MHLAQNSGPPKTQVFIKIQGIFPKTQGQIPQHSDFQKKYEMQFSVTVTEFNKTTYFAHSFSTISIVNCETKVELLRTKVKLTKTQVRILRKLRFSEILDICRTRKNAQKISLRY